MNLETLRRRVLYWFKVDEVANRDKVKLKKRRKSKKEPRTSSLNDGEWVQAHTEFERLPGYTKWRNMEARAYLRKEWSKAQVYAEKANALITRHHENGGGKLGAVWS